MKVNLFLHKDTFCYNGIDSKETLLLKLQNLTVDLAKIKSHCGDNEVHIMVSSSLSLTKVYKDETVFQVLEGLSREARGMFYSILYNTSSLCDYGLSDVEALCNYAKDEEACNSLVYLNAPEIADDATFRSKPYMQFDKYEIIYNYQNWQTLERQILGNHPLSAEHFYNECVRLFTNLYFHEKCKDTLSDVFDKVPRNIMLHLSCMNDKLRQFVETSDMTQANDLIMSFAGKYNLCEGSLNRNVRYKTQLTMLFPKTGKEQGEKEMYCDPHFKLNDYEL